MEKEIKKRRERETEKVLKCGCEGDNCKNTTPSMSIFGSRDDKLNKNIIKVTKLYY